MNNIPDDRAFEQVERDYPNASGAEKYRLAQAVMLLRKSGFRRQEDGCSKMPGEASSQPDESSQAVTDDPIKQWFHRAVKAIESREEDQTVLGELGVELQKLLFEAVLTRNVGGVRLLYCQFMDVSRRQKNVKDRLSWFREAPPRRWISRMTGRIEGAFVPGGVEDEEQYVQKRLSDMPDGGAKRELSAWLKKRIEEEPALIERQDHVTLTNLANQIRERLCGAVLSQDHTLILAIFHKIELDRHWWRTIWHDPIFSAWQREVSSMGEEEQE